MVAEAVSNAELARRMDDVRAALAEDIAEVRTTLATVSTTTLPRELYAARHEALVHRVSLVEAHQARLDGEFRAAMERLERERREEVAEQTREQRQTRRFLISAVLLPAASIAISIYQGLQGPA